MLFLMVKPFIYSQVMCSKRSKFRCVEQLGVHERQENVCEQKIL